MLFNNYFTLRLCTSFYYFFFHSKKMNLTLPDNKAKFT